MKKRVAVGAHTNVRPDLGGSSRTLRRSAEKFLRLGRASGEVGGARNLIASQGPCGLWPVSPREGG